MATPRPIRATRSDAYCDTSVKRFSRLTPRAIPPISAAMAMSSGSPAATSVPNMTRSRTSATTNMTADERVRS